MGKVKTKLVNRTGGEILLQEGNQNVYKAIATLTNNKEYTIYLNPNATYRDYVILTMPDRSQLESSISSDNCLEYSMIIVMRGDNGTYFLETKSRKKTLAPGNPPTPQGTSAPTSAPPQGTSPPPPGTSAPPQGTSPPPPGTSPPPQGSSPPPQGTSAPSQGTSAPSQGTSAPYQGTSAPSQGTSAPSQGRSSAPPQSTSAPAQGTVASINVLRKIKEKFFSLF